METLLIIIIIGVGMNAVMWLLNHIHNEIHTIMTHLNIPIEKRHKK